MLQPFRDIADPELILFAEAEGEAVGWLPCIANLKEAFIHANGLKYPWDYPRLWWHMRRQPECLAIKSVLVLPDYWWGLRYANAAASIECMCNQVGRKTYI